MLLLLFHNSCFLSKYYLDNINILVQILIIFQQYFSFFFSQSSRPLLACIAHTATQNLNSISSGRQPGPHPKGPTPPLLVHPATLRGANTTLLGGSVSVPVDSCYLSLCVLANASVAPECASLIAKVRSAPQCVFLHAIISCKCDYKSETKL